MNPRVDGGPQHFAGADSLSEIISQPQCWADCLKELESSGNISKILEKFRGRSDWLFIGCGSSYYLAQAAAASWTAITDLPARALPASELLLFPDLVLTGRADFVPVLISRSGRTSEVLNATQLLNQKRIPNIAVSCATGQPLQNMASISILLPQADERSAVMTRSFSSMLLALQYLAASLSGKPELIRALNALPEAAEKLLKTLPARVREFVDSHRFSGYVCLGQGPYYGLACESTLKLTEMSCSFAQCFHTLEFRHGPKSIVTPETLITFLLSQTGYEAEKEVIEEVKALGGTTLVIGNKIEDRARAAADLAIELNCDLPEYARLAPYVFVAQLMGLYAGLQKGLDPDRPPNLSRVVILKEELERPQHAAI